MYNFSACISDEIADRFEHKLEACNKLLIPNIEVEEVFDGKGLSELNGDDLESYRNMLVTHSKKIVVYSCSELVENIEHYKILFRKAHLLNIKNIKVKKACSSHKDVSTEEFANHLGRIEGVGKSFGIRVLVENQSGTNMAEDDQITKIFRLVKSNNLGLIFNPLEFVKLKKHPFFNVFYNSKLKNTVRVLRINDGLFMNGMGVFPGEGNAEIRELASILLSRGFNGYFSFTPYLNQKDINTYREIVSIFKKMLTEM